jgi:hypothetical protein
MLCKFIRNHVKSHWHAHLHFLMVLKNFQLHISLNLMLVKQKLKYPFFIPPSYIEKITNYIEIIIIYKILSIIWKPLFLWKILLIIYNHFYYIINCCWSQLNNSGNYRNFVTI